MLKLRKKLPWPLPIPAIPIRCQVDWCQYLKTSRMLRKVFNPLPSSGYHLTVRKTGAGNLKHTVFQETRTLGDDFLITRIHALSPLPTPCEPFGYTTCSAMKCRKNWTSQSHAASTIRSCHKVSRVLLNKLRQATSTFIRKAFILERQIDRYAVYS